ncbi:unnamed protein product [Rotaria magnacalcarata]|uniref:Uncharacterized protein n=4 Tax=Rotaria magnacalcarata TaxID=392030 RepID=A0A816FJX7_9BILA|nr:unnamed protein product [Rotaria magnacalcarata]CAF1662581.1 unnamed protein product [Rotaria magnacalcarata]CAF2123349.1 unnamed protein product [Rotaria magnacalcarata]CAF4062750.1 unnamed protein product [Rotaria magnacalcarata]CAF4101296.1 unnamed protein product [Rotaria magnacalcarata]
MNNRAVSDTTGIAALATTNPLLPGDESIFEVHPTEPDFPYLNIRTIHISRESDRFNPSTNLIGMIIYGYRGATDFYLNNRNCKIGHILIKSSDEINHIQADTTHKKLFKWFFGQDLPPEFIAGGFAYQNGQWKYNALAFNTKQDIYHNNKKGMALTEKQLLGGALSRLYINHRWQQDPNISVREIFSSNEGWQLFESVNIVVNPNRVDKVNKYGRAATIGVTGKYYCGDYLDVIRCSCCDGRCGPGNGCNCSGCMELDIENRRLPKGTLVNRDGAPASRSRIDGKTFYCGRPVLRRTNYCDGYCGPNNGPQCYACQALNEQTPRYKTLLNEYDYT